MRAAVFSGTSDGKALCSYLFDNNIDVTAYVATDYGKEVWSREDIPICTGRLDYKEMTESLKGYDLVIDSTHPYASLVTDNLIKACNTLNIPYLRMERGEERAEGAIYVKDIKGAVEYLMKSNKTVFLSTGSKEIEAFIPIKNRVTARVLDNAEVREKCSSLGFKSLIYKKGPFTLEDNLKDFKDCEVLVTKSSGKEGGFSEKLNAARALNMEILIIERPENSKGYSLEEIKEMVLKRRF